MARTRYLKPEFFTDADIAELAPLCRLFYQGLWGQADREGRLLDEPRELRARILPFDIADGEAMLTKLAEKGFVIRYEVAGVRYICIPTLTKHQHFHRDERARGLPPPPTVSAKPPDIIRAPGEHGADTVLAPGQHPVSTPGNGERVTGNGELPPAGAHPRAEPEPEPPPRQKQDEAVPWGTASPSLREAYALVYTQERSCNYVWNADKHRPRADDDGLTTLQDIPTAEQLARWRTALRRKTFPTCDTVADLAKFVNSYPPTSLAGPPDNASTGPRAKTAPAPETPQTPAQRVWREVLERLRADGKTYSLQWLERLHAIGFSRHRLALQGKDKFFCSWVQDHYGELLDHILAARGLGLVLVAQDIPHGLAITPEPHWPDDASAEDTRPMCLPPGAEKWFQTFAPAEALA